MPLSQTDDLDVHPERRHGDRYVAAEIRGKTLVIDLEVRNLSTSGMAVELSQGLKVGTSYPFTMSQGEDEVVVDGNVRWCRFAGTVPLSPEEHRPVFRAGISFTKIRTPIPTGIWTELRTATSMDTGDSTKDE